MQFIPPLFADVDWVKLGTFLVIGTVWLINLVASRLRDRQLAKNRPPRPVREANDATKELADFLKKTSTQGRQATSQKPAAPAATARPEPRSRAARRKAEEQEKRRRKQATPTPALVNLLESELTRDVVKPVGEEQIRPSIDTHKFAERAAHLGHLETDHKIEQHLQQAFSHQVGTLSGGTPANLAAANRNAAAVA